MNEVTHDREKLASTLYGDPYQYDLLAQMTAPPDLPMYHRIVQEHRGSVLELACGTGRVCLDLVSEGVMVAGIDISEPMIAWAKERASGLGLSSRLRVADMRDFHVVDETFEMILVAYNSFNHLYTMADITGCLSSVKRHLGDNGRLVIDTFNPDPLKLTVRRSEATKILEYQDPKGGEIISIFESNQYDAEAQVNHVTWTYETSETAIVRADELSMRVFFPQELDALLAFHGFEIEQKLGDYDGSPFTSASAHQIVICARR